MPRKLNLTFKTVLAEPSTKNVLIVEGLQKIFERLLRPPLIAVNDVSFVVEAGKCFGILGPKKSGKTTTFKILTGEILPTKGDSWILNVKLSEDRNKVNFINTSSHFYIDLNYNIYRTNLNVEV